MNGPESEAFTFVVLHRAAPQGSKVMDKGKNGKPFMRESSKGVRPFRTALRRAAMGSDGRPRAKFLGPVTISIEFEFQRPRSNSDEHATTQGTVGDVDKLSRAVLDGLTEAGVIEDDRFVVKLVATKAWGDEDRAVITVAPLLADGTRQTVDFVGQMGAHAQSDFKAAMDEIDIPKARNPFDVAQCCNVVDHKSCLMFGSGNCPCPDHCTA